MWNKEGEKKCGDLCGGDIKVKKKRLWKFILKKVERTGVYPLWVIVTFW